MRAKKLTYTIFLNVVVWVLSLLMLIPLLLILINSFKSSLEASHMNLALPTQWHFENYAVVAEKGKLGMAFLNSMLYSVGSVMLTTLFSAASAFVLSRRKSKLHNILYFFIVLGIAMPINYVSLMQVMQLFNLMGTRIGVIFLYTSIQIPFNVFLIYSFISKIPRDIDEAAIIDGCSATQMFFKIISPLLKPVLMTVVVLTFLNTWNEFVLPLYLTKHSTQWPMTLAVYNFFGMYFQDWNLVCVDIVLTSLPVIIIYLLGQKHIVSGMTAGSVKG